MTFWQELKRKIAPRRFQEDHEGQEALLEAHSELAVVKSKSQEVDRVTASLRSLRERNHFGEAVEEAMLLRRSRS